VALTAQELTAAESIQRGPEQIFKQRSGTLLIGIRQCGFIRRTIDAQMNEFAQAAAETIANIAE
jgi:hypothetical protein